MKEEIRTYESYKQYHRSLSVVNDLLKMKMFEENGNSEGKFFLGCRAKNYV